MASGVYEIVNAVNGKRYVGSSAGLERRKINHFTARWAKTRETKGNSRVDKTNAALPVLCGLGAFWWARR